MDFNNLQNLLRTRGGRRFKSCRPDAQQGVSPFLGNVAFDLQKMPCRSSFERFLLLTAAVNQALLAAKLDRFATGKNNPAEDLLEVELPA